ncbi:MAG: DinB family protein [Ignavibacteria bacterium]|nr:DinB family protein [Ignavibacteria bacterium]
MIKENLISEIQEEAKATKKILERIPDESLTWKPHEKSMPLERLASHVAEINGWIELIMETDELDFAKLDYKPPKILKNEDLIKICDESLKKALESLKKASEEDFKRTWTMRYDKIIYFKKPKDVTLRTFALNHLYHHRGQLTIYLRLLNISVPGTYGPTADEQPEV